jgi:hypothetical protein
MSGGKAHVRAMFVRSSDFKLIHKGRSPNSRPIAAPWLGIGCYLMDPIEAA